MAAEQPTRRTAERAAERRRLEAHRQPLDERWRRAVRRWKASYDEVAEILESKPYRFARTMPECPHWYTLWTSWTADGTEDAWTDELDRLWGCVVGHIRIYGVPEQYVAPDGHTWSGRPGSLLTLAPHRSGRAGSAASGSSTDSFATRRRVPAGPGSQAMATAIPQACLASSAIRCRDVETGPNLGVLAVFPSNGATCRCPLPSTGSRGLNSPASAVL